ncbi:uncharacterized protein LOC132701221 [Cylas formicarius]|uniref:uncharacterized protein LOC132701221 n=1 Tax=Cylas formicarius TaxID=197179 RepID=UPI002958B3C5|nr:uncharacterized protein LOC132701221 [Cylas formicarius]
MSLQGKYTFVKDEGMDEFFASLPPDALKAAAYKELEITVGDGVIIAKSPEREKKYDITQTVEETFPDGKKGKTTATLKGNVLTVETVGEQGLFKRIFSATASGLEVVVSNGKAQGKRIFSRV